MFDHPSVREICAFLMSKYGPGSSAQVGGYESLLVPQSSRSEMSSLILGRSSGLQSCVGVSSVALRWAGRTYSAEGFRRGLVMGTDCMVEVPLVRFDIEPCFDLGREEGKSYVRHGGLIEEVEFFDRDIFGIVAAEAKAMAPEQRHLLEMALVATAGAAWGKAGLLSSWTGCFVG